MSNHFHILLEVPPLPGGCISDSELLRRLGVFYGENFVKSVEDELLAARAEGGLPGGNPERVAEIHGRFTKRMHDLSEFMKTLLQRFTRWFNRTHQRSGTLWEEQARLRALNQASSLLGIALTETSSQTQEEATPLLLTCHSPPMLFEDFRDEGERAEENQRS